CPWMRALDAIENAAPQASPVAGTVQSTDRQEALRIAGLPNVDAALSNFANDCTQDNAVGLVQAILDAAPQASAEAELRAAYNEWQDKTDFIQEWVQSGKLPVKYLGWHRADVMRDLIEQATPAPTAVEGVDDVALPPIPHEWAPIIPSAFAGALLEWAKAYARAALSAQPGAIRNPLIAEPSGNPGELERAGDAPREDDMLTIAYLARAQAEKERAALAARKEGDALSATQTEQGEQDA
ncbi:hypothetical protein, partial [Listeria monocytogenes]|uniref:hypothetical protein n=1 Tax=Listeria monocytogenes TaxID=1639 RepID=UPI0031407356